MEYRHLRGGYRCQRNRNKSRYQILLEWLARSVGNPSLSSKLMQSSLALHGLKNGLKPSQAHRSFSREEECANVITGRFFVDTQDENLWRAYKAHFSTKIPKLLEDADRICRHEFDLLGSGPSYLGDPIDWHVDPVSGCRWPKRIFFDLKKSRNYPKGSDIKWPWELSRFQHLPTLGKAYRVSEDERYANEIVDQVSHWLDDNPCPYGVNWCCAMEAAIRIMNIIWAYLLIKNVTVVKDEFRARLGRSIFQHGQYILFNLEYGLRADGSIKNGNHYLTDVVGLLYLALLCPHFKMASHWKAFAVKALIEEMDGQVHPDGVHFESSLSYHRLVLELFTAAALLCRANDVTLPKKFWIKLERMFEAVLCLIRPDGKIPPVGDADDGRLFILSDYGDWDRNNFRYLLSTGAALFHRADMKAHAGEFSEETFWLLGSAGARTFADLKSHRAQPSSEAFPDAGLYVLRGGDHYLLTLCGKLGAADTGSHKHNDLLSFELYSGDKAFIVDPGTYVYTRCPEWRNLFRSTKYHNTVMIDGQEQNAFHPERLFDMSPDADVIIHEWLCTADIDRLDVEHTGYLRSDPPVRHRRQFAFDKKEENWQIIDHLEGAGSHTAEWYFHFDHGIELELCGDGFCRTRCAGTNLAMVIRSTTPLVPSLLDGWVSPRYGYKCPSRILHIVGQFESSCTMTMTLKEI